MVDRLSKERRSWNMGRIGAANTAPEKTVRSLLHTLGVRFRLHQRTLPGKPDLALKRWKTVIFVHGCFWHRHEGCRFAYVPKSRVDFWQKKFFDNTVRDRRVQSVLRASGWRVLVVWECETADRRRLERRLRRYFPIAARPRLVTGGGPRPAAGTAHKRQDDPKRLRTPPNGR